MKNWAIAHVSVSWYPVTVIHETKPSKELVMSKGISPQAKKIKALREELGLTQKEVAQRAGLTESAYRAYELGDRKPKLEAVEKLAKVFEVKAEYLSTPEFRNQEEFVYALMDCEDLFGFEPREIDGIAAIVPDPDAEGDGFARFVRGWCNVRRKLDAQEITSEEYEKWKRS